MGRVERFEGLDSQTHQLIIRDDGTKIIDDVFIPDKKKLRQWMKKHHPEYYDECEANGEFDEE